jgi:hypothetical protein
VGAPRGVTSQAVETGRDVDGRIVGHDYDAYRWNRAAPSPHFCVHHSPFDGFVPRLTTRLFGSCSAPEGETVRTARPFVAAMDGPPQGVTLQGGAPLALS